MFIILLFFIIFIYIKVGATPLQRIQRHATVRTGQRTQEEPVPKSPASTSLVRIKTGK